MQKQSRHQNCMPQLKHQVLKLELDCPWTWMGGEKSTIILSLSMLVKTYGANKNPTEKTWDIF